MRQYNRGNLSPRSLASALPQGPPYSLVNNGQAHTREAYRDLLIFEERLKQNSERLASQRRKYEAFLLSLILSIILLSYYTFISPSPYTLFQFLNSGLLLIGIVTLILFFATGVYSEKIAYAYKFVPQANRALRYFNIYLNTKKPPRKWSLFNPLTWFRISSLNSDATTTGTGGLSRVSSNSGLRKTSTSSRSRSLTLSSASSSPFSSSPSSPSSTRNIIPLAPLPPANNPRGELIFSSKVPTAYRDGYEKYRSDWEKRRELNKPKNQLSYPVWILSFVLPASWMARRKEQTNQPSTVSAKEGTSTDKKQRTSHRGGGHTSSISYAATPSEYSDSSSVEQPHQHGSFKSQSSSSARETRGRDMTTRPLLARSGSSSAITSSTFSSTTSPPISRRASPLRTGIISVNIPISSSSSRASPSNITTNASRHAGAASSGTSSRASTPDLIPEEEEEEGRDYMKYYPHNRDCKDTSDRRTGASSPDSISSSSISIATSSQSLLFSNVPIAGGGSSTGRSRRQYLGSATSDDYDDDDDSLKSPPDMSPHSKEAVLSNLGGNGTGMKSLNGSTRRRSRASSFNEFLAELREDGMD